MIAGRNYDRDRGNPWLRGRGGVRDPPFDVFRIVIEQVSRAVPTLTLVWR
ncbi:MAG: hypothetical protein JWP87_5934 [Labilithrix sp.]|jgi:hypothetical protein|nr:hypothetical protein [Labilithrix sp.]